MVDSATNHARRISFLYNFSRSENVHHDSWQQAADDFTLRIADKYIDLNILVKFDPTIQNSGAS